MAIDCSFIVFDLDGTLIDSRGDITNAVNFTLSRFGIGEVDLDLIAEHIGTGVMPLIEETLSKNGVESIEAARTIFGDYYEGHLTEQTKLFDGIEDILVHFSSIPKVVLTNKSNRFASPILNSLGVETHFLGCYGRESFQTRKPDAGPLLAIAQEFGITPEDMMMIGDTEVDVFAGKGAGTRTVAACYGYSKPENLLAADPDFQISSPSDLKSIISLN